MAHLKLVCNQVTPYRLLSIAAVATVCYFVRLTEGQWKLMNQPLSYSAREDAMYTVAEGNNGTISNDVPHSKKLIMLWTEFDKNTGTSAAVSNKYNAALHGCIYKECIITTDKSRIQEADMVFMKGRQMDVDGSGWPAFRSPKQLYVHHMGERPGYWHEFLKEFDNKINLTMNYRHSADISVPFQELFKLPDPKPGAYQLRIPLRNKTRMAVWPVSHCIADSKRQDYIKELSKYIDVDIYGKCGNLSCPRLEPMSCYPEWERHYKFYLSFENAICDDYITEKYYKPLKFELVPVIFSGDRYNSETPPHDAIDARNFDAPYDLAKFLVALGENEEEYSRYFQWKHTYEFRCSRPGPFCKLCEAAHTFENKPAHSNYYDWWFNHCDNGLVDRMKLHANW